MTTLEQWLAPRLTSAPASLRNRVLQAANQDGGAATDDVAPRLRALAEQLLGVAKSGPPTRDTALTLLAADALITLAVETEVGEAGHGLRQ